MQKKDYLLEECPHCGSYWNVGTEEYECQQCDCCGYPDFDDDDFDDDDFDDDDYLESL